MAIRVRMADRFCPFTRIQVVR